MSARFATRSLGERSIRSPLSFVAPFVHGLPDGAPGFTHDDAGVLYDIELPRHASHVVPRAFERAGPREMIFFDPKKVTAGVVTAGGVCPGINNVLRSIAVELRHRYGVERILGFRYGFAGLDVRSSEIPFELTTDVVRDIHSRGGTFLGTSRGICDVEFLTAGLAKWGVDVLFTIGGDGTMRAAHMIDAEARKRGMRVAVVGVPKTIDNDIPFVDKTFGFDTAIATARMAIDAAHAEARSVDRGVGLVKLMGRHAGFIATHATLASHDVNACLIPEVPFELGGPGGFLAWLDERLARRRHALVVVAEGCSKGFEGLPVELDASGNVRFNTEAGDVGHLLRHAIEQHFEGSGRKATLKYIDPSYMVRALRATAEDAIFCDALARHAVHAAMAGKTDILVGRWHRRFTHVGLDDVLAHVKRVDPTSDLWCQVLESTGQPPFRNSTSERSERAVVK
jgi:6-phosphofructokinase 1